MDTQKQFKGLMEKITGSKLADKMQDSKPSLEKSCNEMQKTLMPFFDIDIASGNEPFPFCYSGGNRPAELVWIGLNPGAPLDRCKKWEWENSSWQDIIEYCVPMTDIRECQGENTYLTFLNEKGTELETDYYRFVLRIQMALLEDEVCDTWKDVQDKCKKLGITTADLFLERFSTHPVLNAEMIPYKSKGINFQSESLIKNEKYISYFRTLLNFAEEIALPNAWFVFFGAPKEVRKILKYVHDEWNVPDEKDSIKIPDDDGQEFYIFQADNRKMILSPFIKRYSVNYRITKLIRKMKDFESNVEK